MCIVCEADNLHEMLRLVFSKKKKKKNCCRCDQVTGALWVDILTILVAFGLIHLTIRHFTIFMAKDWDDFYRTRMCKQILMLYW